MSAREIAERVPGEGRIAFMHPDGGGYTDRLSDDQLRAYLENSIADGEVNHAAFTAATLALRAREAAS